MLCQKAFKRELFAAVIVGITVIGIVFWNRMKS